MRNITSKVNNHTDLPPIKAHYRGMKIFRLLYQRRVKIAKQDDSYVIKDSRGRLLLAGVQFPTKDVAKEYLRESQLFHA